LIELKLPYGMGEASFKVHENNFLGVLKPREKRGAKDPVAEISHALENPIGTKRLREIAKRGEKVAIVIDDMTRPTPSYLMLPPILSELELADVKKEDVTVVIGTGVHRAATRDEIVKLVGEYVSKLVKVINHDCDAQDLVYLGKTSFGTEVCLNKDFAEADVKILTGDVELHPYAGYGGGRKSVVPAVAGRKTIMQNHSLFLRAEQRSRRNLVHEDMMEAAKLAKVDFILNVVLNVKNEIVKAFAGDLERAFWEGVKLVDEMYKIEVESLADILITSAGGFPFDVNFYQSIKAVFNSINAVREGGVVVLLAECKEGHGNEAFYECMLNFRDSKEAKEEIMKNFTVEGMIAHGFLKCLEKVNVILVSNLPKRYEKAFKLRIVDEVASALKIAFDIIGKDAKVYVVPHGSKTGITVKGSN